MLLFLLLFFSIERIIYLELTCFSDNLSFVVVQEGGCG